MEARVEVGAVVWPSQCGPPWLRAAQLAAVAAAAAAAATTVSVSDELAAAAGVAFDR